MDATRMVPKVPLNKFKRTKIIATVGPATDSYEAILDMLKAGANGFRLNFSHGTPEEHHQQIKWIRQAAKAYGKPAAVIQDLQGPKIRLGDFEGVIQIKTGQNIQLQYKGDYERSGNIPTQYDLSKKVKRGHRVYMYDGKVQAIVTSIIDGVVHAKAENSGMLIKRKGINLPDTDFGGDVITIKDKKDLAFEGLGDVDYIAQSFVQSALDIENMRTLLRNLGSKARIIAKVETKAAVDNIEEIMQAADAVMVARGDLAVETLPESVPVLQRHIIGLGLKYKKPTIVATQMLLSMTEQPEPTRAEVSDVATAVIVGADATMLSDETANGQYPLDSVKVMKRIIMYTQNNSTVKASFSELTKEDSNQNAISSAVIELASSLEAKAIVAETKSGETAIQIASYRSDKPVIAVTSDVTVTNQLAIVYGVKSYQRPVDKMAATKLTNWLLQSKVLKEGDVIVTASGQYPGVVGTTDTIKVRVL
jgi:pyruvate kinase